MARSEPNIRWTERPDAIYPDAALAVRFHYDEIEVAVLSPVISFV
jgi:hypothetical protein